MHHRYESRTGLRASARPPKEHKGRGLARPLLPVFPACRLLVLSRGRAAGRGGESASHARTGSSPLSPLRWALSTLSSPLAPLVCRAPAKVSKQGVLPGVDRWATAARARGMESSGAAGSNKTARTPYSKSCPTTAGRAPSAATSLRLRSDACPKTLNPKRLHPQSLPLDQGIPCLMYRSGFMQRTELVQHTAP